MTRPVRMSDVAKMARVGTMTVSRVLNGNVKVSEGIRVRVLDAVAKLDYHPNEIARSLRDRRTRQIGIILPNLYDPFFAICAHSINLIAQEHSYSTIITNSDEDPAKELIEAKRMLRRHIEGLVIIPAFGKSGLLDPEFKGTPIVTVDRPLAGSTFDSVVVENQRGVQLGIQHLIDHKHRRIAFIGLTLQLWTIRQRQQGYKKTMEAAGLKVDSHVVSESQAEMLELVRMLIARKSPPTAFFCSNNLTTRNALHALSKLGVSVPEKVALVGFDDFEMADIVAPPVTVVRQPVEMVGKIAAELLFRRVIAGGKPSKPQRITLPAELVVRRSCGAHHP